MLKVINTLTKNLEEFQPLEDNLVKVYQCGPTVYSQQHIGNLRAAVLGDLIRRGLLYLDYDVQFARNITDVGHLSSDADEGEDKMAKGAQREGLSPQEIAAKYTHIFHQDLAALNVATPDFEPQASQYVRDMIALIEILLDKGFAYTTPSAVYFDISKAADYTRLSGQKLDLNKTGAGHGGVDDQDNKRNAEDFALWFFQTGAHAKALQVWPSPFVSPAVEEGLGLPGWHIECSAMIKALLGNTIDIHLGGIEHIPVHHTNEIAQSESANGEEFVKYWLHYEHLMVDGGKMAKSDGTVVYVDTIVEKGIDPIALRYFFLQSHYRSKQNFTWEALQASATAYKRLQAQVAELFTQVGSDCEPLPAAVDAAAKNEFVAAIENDFNIPAALAVVWDVLKSDGAADVKLATIVDFDRILGLKLADADNPHTQKDLPAEAQALIQERAQARADKDWAKADALRARLQAEFNIEVKDTAEGQKVI